MNTDSVEVTNLITAWNMVWTGLRTEIIYHSFNAWEKSTESSQPDKVTYLKYGHEASFVGLCCPLSFLKYQWDPPASHTKLPGECLGNNKWDSILVLFQSNRNSGSLYVNLRLIMCSCLDENSFEGIAQSELTKKLQNPDCNFGFSSLLQKTGSCVVIDNSRCKNTANSGC